MILARARDIVIAGVGAVVMFPLLMLIGLLVGVVDGTPILFKQHRSGLNGAPFTVFKFRTMAIACDAQDQFLPDAMRVTTLGRWLRFLRLDELPQLWNVLIGDMSLVGPRPLLPITIFAAGNDALGRGAIRPGLTGWAQICGNALLSDHDKIALDKWYVANRSHRLDIAIMARTVAVVMRGERIDPLAIRMAHARSTHRRG